jgi:hypothetical protein
LKFQHPPEGALVRGKRSGRRTVNQTGGEYSNFKISLFIFQFLSDVRATEQAKSTLIGLSMSVCPSRSLLKPGGHGKCPIVDNRCASNGTDTFVGTRSDVTMTCLMRLGKYLWYVSVLQTAHLSSLLHPPVDKDNSVAGALNWPYIQ